MRIIKVGKTGNSLSLAIPHHMVRECEIKRTDYYEVHVLGINELRYLRIKPNTPQIMKAKKGRKHGA